MESIFKALRVATSFVGCVAFLSSATAEETAAPAPVPIQGGIYCSMVKPVFPPESQAAHESGTTKLAFVLGLTGKFEDITVVQSSGYPRLDESAIKAVEASHCLPHYQDGKAVRVRLDAPFTFSPN